jgi:F-type H+-transporting ATPase subunit b
MRRSLAPSLLLLAALAAPAAAQEHGEGGGGGLLSINPGLIIWTILIFLIVLAILSKFAFPKILGAVEARERHLNELAESAERDRAEAARLLEENRRLLDETRARVQEALAESRTSAEGLQAQALAEARREREELLARARHDIANEREVALEAVKREAVELAIRAAEKLIRESLDAEDNRRLVREFLGQVSARRAPAAAGAAGD